ncbi:type II secretion system F family protein [Paenarthrobacter sp. NPDC056912]|uniref:type II secretion system F family protein n=1 Tax=Paenarthrobacter sp. NPDC056912 TaxID=3345965 RepID=UPI00366F2D77
MIAVVVASALAAWLQLGAPRRDSRRKLTSLGLSADKGSGAAGTVSFWQRARLPRRQSARPLPLVVLVQQLAALLRGGRGHSKLWEELWLVHGPQPNENGRATSFTKPDSARLSAESLRVLAASRAASAVGNSPAEAIRTTAGKTYPRRGSTERRVWMELAACLEVAETSGCPLAELLTRFAAQLEAEEDAEAARQTALAGPKATVRLLSWLPVFGLGLGMALGVDPLGILLDNVLGVATLAAGLLLTVAGRVWSSRLVAAAAGGT